MTSRGYLGYCTVLAFPLADEWALFDVGHYGDRHLLLAALEAWGLEPEGIRHVVLSHLHFDHCLNLPLFPEAAVYLARAEIEYAQKAAGGEDTALPDFWPALLEKRKLVLVEKELTLSASCQLSLKPGHTPGGLVLLYQGSRRTAVCGDAIKNAWEALTGEIAQARAGRAAARTSLEDILDWAEVIVPGHDRPFAWTDREPEFLAGFDWEIRGSLYPEAADLPLLNIHLPAGTGRGQVGHIRTNPKSTNEEEG
ncbi:MAG: MBL fold metallo-hydrolase [Thermodesulfobacteriota bacterium]